MIEISFCALYEINKFIPVFSGYENIFFKYYIFAYHFHNWHRVLECRRCQPVRMILCTWCNNRTYKSVVFAILLNNAFLYLWKINTDARKWMYTYIIKKNTNISISKADIFKASIETSKISDYNASLYSADCNTNLL